MIDWLRYEVPLWFHSVMSSVPRHGIVVYVSATDEGRVRTLGIQPLFSQQTVLYYSRARIVSAVAAGAELKLRQGTKLGPKLRIARGKYLTTGIGDADCDDLGG